MRSPAADRGSSYEPPRARRAAREHKRATFLRKSAKSAGDRSLLPAEVDQLVLVVRPVDLDDAVEWHVGARPHGAFFISQTSLCRIEFISLFVVDLQRQCHG